MRIIAPATFVFCLWSLSGCGTAPAPRAGDGTLVVLRTGPRREPLDAATSREVFQGHFANMRRLADAGHLLLAGPYGTEKSDPAFRGVFLLATADLAQAKSWAETDPGFLAGVFAFDYHRFTTTAPLRHVLDRELAAEQAAKAAGKERKPGDGGRSYVLVTADTAAAPVLAGRDDVLLRLELADGRTLAWFDATQVATVRERLQPEAPAGALQFDAWFGSGFLTELPRAGG